MPDGNRARSKSMMRRLPARPNQGNGGKNHELVVHTDGGCEQGRWGKARTVGVDGDGTLDYEYAQGTQGRHFPQGDI